MSKEDKDKFAAEAAYGEVIPNKFEEAAEEADEASAEDVEVENLDENIIELEDGSAVVILDDEDDGPQSEKFYENLAAKLIPKEELSVMASELYELVKRDAESRSDRDKQYAEGIKRTGMGGEAPGGADFEGASKVVHPVLAEGCVDFASRTIKEIFPARGPVRTNIVVSGDEAIAKATRKEKYLNWQLTTQIAEYRDESEQMLTQLPLGGSQYKKWWFDKSLGRPTVEFIPVDNVYLPYAAISFYTARRATIYQQIVRGTFEERVASGFYHISQEGQRSDPSQFTLQQTDSERATDRIEGKEMQAYDEDGLRGIYEIYVYLDIPEDPLNKDEKELPYVVHMDVSTESILGVYRNWEEKDERQRKLDWVVEYKFIPWRGAYGIGLMHLIGSLAVALTGAIRSLMDSALINNFPGLVKLKGSGLNAQNVEVEACSITDVESNGATDDIRKLIMAMPFNPPSAVLMQLVDKLTEYAKGVVNTAEERIADAGANMPVGTALALIEQGSITFSAIHSRMHAAQARELRILCRINATYVDEKEQEEEFGAVLVTREDFEKSDDIIPVSDPNIFSDAQRFAQLQAILQIAEKYPQFFDMSEIVDIALELLKFPDPDRIRQKQPVPFHANAVAENVAVSSGAMLLADPKDDHIGHLVNHLQFATNPLMGSLMSPTAVMQLGEHIKQHMLFYYAQQARAIAEETIDGEIGTLIKEGDHAEVDKTLATTSEQVLNAIGESLKEVLTLYAAFQKKQGEMQKMQEQSMLAKDPVMAQVAAANRETDRRAAEDAAKNKLEALKFEEQKQSSTREFMAELMRSQEAFKSDMIKLITPLLGPMPAIQALQAQEQPAPPMPQAPMPGAGQQVPPGTPQPPPMQVQGNPDALPPQGV
jgi:hypothetical protein